MLLFAHTGIALGLGWLIKEKDASSLLVAKANPLQSASVLKKPNSPLKSLLAGMDLRILIIGSMLPDIIDKPLGQIILHDSLNNGRIYAHTLLFLLVLIISGVFLYHRQKLWMLLLAGGTFVHLLLDGMWMAPKTLFWPLLGNYFPRSDMPISEWIAMMIQELRYAPIIITPEVIGAVILAVFTVILIKRKKLRSFLYYGEIH